MGALPPGSPVPGRLLLAPVRLAYSLQRCGVCGAPAYLVGADGVAQCVWCAADACKEAEERARRWRFLGTPRRLFRAWRLRRHLRNPQPGEVVR